MWTQSRNPKTSLLGVALLETVVPSRTGGSAGFGGVRPVRPDTVGRRDRVGSGGKDCPLDGQEHPRTEL